MTDPTNALLGEMAAALQSLANEASAGVEAVRALWGNTNANCLKRRIDQARVLLSSDAAQAALRERDALLAVVAAARCILHWHDTEDGMVVSKKKVFELWDALTRYDTAMGERGNG